jgi:hypothetical protein
MRLLLRNAFLIFGLLTLLAATVFASGELTPVVRVLIIPQYLAWLLVGQTTATSFGASAESGLTVWLVSAAQLTAGLGPYALLDLLMSRAVPRLSSRDGNTWR